MSTMKTTTNAWKIVAACSLAFFATTAAIACGGEEHRAAAPTGGGACRGQPNMEGALSELRAARGSLERAEHDKGGWRAKAIEETNVAIRETEKGCAYADAH
jgi:hypothetical protein